MDDKPAFSINLSKADLVFILILGCVLVPAAMIFSLSGTTVKTISGASMVGWFVWSGFIWPRIQRRRNGGK